MLDSFQCHSPTIATPLAPKTCLHAQTSPPGHWDNIPPHAKSLQAQSTQQTNLSSLVVLLLPPRIVTHMRHDRLWQWHHDWHTECILPYHWWNTIKWTPQKHQFTSWEALLLRSGGTMISKPCKAQLGTGTIWCIDFKTSIFFFFLFFFCLYYLTMAQ